MKRIVVGIVVIGIVIGGYFGFLAIHTLQNHDVPAQDRIALGEQIAIGTPSRDDIDDDVLWDNDGQTSVHDINLDGFRLQISTPKLSLDLPIVDGVSLKQLAQGLGHHITTAYPNEKEGNVVLSGHRWYPGKNPYYQALIDVDRLEVGDDIRVHYDGKEYRYRVEREEVVAPDRTDVLAQTTHPQLTLYTCTPKYTAKNRLVFVAPLIEVTPLQHTDTSE